MCNICKIENKIAFFSMCWVFFVEPLFFFFCIDSKREVTLFIYVCQPRKGKMATKRFASHTEAEIFKKGASVV